MLDLTDRPVRLIVADDLGRSRPTVIFRLILAIPVWIVLAFWSIAAFFVAIAAWFVVLVRGQCSEGIHEFLSAYLRYSVQVSAYLHLTADPYPGFATKADYPVRVEVRDPAPQRRWTVALRIFMLLPALALASAVGGSSAISIPTRRRSSSYGAGGLGLGAIVAILGWFAIVARGRMPRGLRDCSAYGIGYSAQVLAYGLLLTDVYPSADPRLAGPMALPEHPVALEFRDDLSRPRLIVFFRLLLALPHLVWFTLWSIAALLAVLLGWLVAPFPGRLPLFLHRFLGAYVRYSTHLSAFLGLVGGPFPGFVGAPGSYPVDLRIAERERQGRWGLVFRGVLAIPAFLIAGGYGGVGFVVAVLGWFSALARGRMPEGMTTLGAVALRYQSQFWAYALLLTPHYPYSATTLEDTTEPEHEPGPVPVDPWSTEVA
jgi:uncharacterized protein DUF4389